MIAILNKTKMNYIVDRKNCRSVCISIDEILNAFSTEFVEHRNNEKTEFPEAQIYFVNSRRRRFAGESRHR